MENEQATEPKGALAAKPELKPIMTKRYVERATGAILAIAFDQNTGISTETRQHDGHSTVTKHKGALNLPVHKYDEVKDEPAKA